MSVDASSASPDSAKKERKEALKKEADKLGIPYKELKEQKKKAKEERKSSSKGSREAKALQKDMQHDPEYQHQQRMRAWSKDFEEPTNGKRRRTRSMDAAEHEEKKDKQVKKVHIDADSWRTENDLTVVKLSDRSFVPPDPYLDFKDAPFPEGIQRALTRAGFDKPTLIQSQVSF